MDQGPRRSEVTPRSALRQHPGLARLARRALDGARTIAELDAVGALAVQVLDEPLRLELLECARAARYRPARPLVGEAGRRVHQRMEVCDHFPAESIFRGFAVAFGALCRARLAGIEGGPFEGRLHFNDLMLQRYSVGEIGITPHRDRTGYRNLVCLFVLAGAGRFYVCDDRDGCGAREVSHAPGDVILMRAPGYRGSSARPFHFVRDITTDRYVFGLRQERDPATRFRGGGRVAAQSGLR